MIIYFINLPAIIAGWFIILIYDCLQFYKLVFSIEVRIHMVKSKLRWFIILTYGIL